MGLHKKQAVAAALLVLAFASGMFNHFVHSANDGALQSNQYGRSSLYVAEEVNPTPEPTPTSVPDMEPGGGSGTGG